MAAPSDKDTPYTVKWENSIPAAQGSSTTTVPLGSIYEATPCPFDLDEDGQPTHSHRRGRHSVDHVFNCRLKQRSLNSTLEPLIKYCQFNASHWIHVDQMEEHLKNSCPDFKEWIRTQTLNGFPLSLDPRDLIKKKKSEDSTTSTSNREPNPVAAGATDKEEADSAFKDLPSNIAEFLKQKNLQIR